MSNQLGELELEDAAQDIVGNWKRFDCFVWYRDEIEDAENWTIVYTHHRDSGLLDQSNAHVINAALEPFSDGDDPEVVMESHNHWAVGHIDGFSIRVLRDGKITDAFRKYHELAESMANYSILDEEDYSNRELEATWENIPHAAAGIKDDYDLPMTGQIRSTIGSATIAATLLKTFQIKGAGQTKTIFEMLSNPLDMNN